MPPKKAQTNDSDAHKAADVPAQAINSKDQPSSNDTNDKVKANGKTSKKRKAHQSSDSSKLRRSARGTPSTSTPTNPLKILQYLLSPSSLDLCRPKDEIEDLKERGKNIRTYSSSTFTPFEELICATILSRPISHMLGLRSIRTIFNAPYEFITPKKVREAGTEGCREAFDKARTQHRQKTAEELVLLANAVVEHLGNGEDDVSLERVREEGQHDAEKEGKMLKKHVKGFGKTGLNIFGRRIQRVWPAFYPFADEKTLAALKKLGLPNSAEELKELLDEQWGDLEVNNVQATDEEEKKRKVFVQILERAVGADLEGNIDSLKANAA